MRIRLVCKGDLKKIGKRIHTKNYIYATRLYIKRTKYRSGIYTSLDQMSML